MFVDRNQGRVILGSRAAGRPIVFCRWSGDDDRDFENLKSEIFEEIANVRKSGFLNKNYYFLLEKRIFF